MFHRPGRDKVMPPPVSARGQAIESISEEVHNMQAETPEPAFILRADQATLRSNIGSFRIAIRPSRRARPLNAAGLSPMAARTVVMTRWRLAGVTRTGNPRHRR